jgi:hypothetical protein
MLALPLLLALLQPAPAYSQNTIEQIRESFIAPPDDARIMMRWWWFGPAIDQTELQHELELMKAGGIGGVELQSVYPLELDDAQSGFHNSAFLSTEHLNAISFASRTAQSLGLRMNLTLGSGWPYGGATVPVTDAASRLRVVSMAASDNAASVALPSIRNGEKLLAAFLVAGTPDKYVVEHAQALSDIRDARLLLPSNLTGAHTALFFIASRTGQQVKRPAVGAEGLVIDHFSRSAIAHYLDNVAEPLIKAFGDHPPDSVFSDSLEVYGADWTPDFLQQFQTRRGYDLTPYLPQLVAGSGASTDDLRYDWGRTLTELIDENYLSRINDWAHAHHTQFRSQTYGHPAVTLSSNRLTDLIEGEGSQWHGYSFTRWATSASHVFGRPITSAEAWTSMHAPAFRATPLDMKAAADAFFLQGINQLIGHGWPYSPQSAGEPGWSLYAAGVFNNHNPWWIVMPDMTRYLQRISYLMRLGKPANDVAILLPTEDAQAHFRPGVVSVTDAMRTLLGGELIPQILDAGYGFDFIDAQAIEDVGIPFKVLVLPAIERLPLSTYRKIQDYQRRGGMVVTTKAWPSRAPGMVESQRDSADVQRISAQLSKSHGAVLVTDVNQLGQALRGVLRPDVTLTPATPQIGFIHRRLPDADIYFIANTDNQPHSVEASFHTDKPHAQFWNAFTGGFMDANRNNITLALAPYESRVLVFSKTMTTKSLQRDVRAQSVSTALPATSLDLSHDWKITFDASGLSQQLQSLQSWTDNEATRFYSGTVTYERTIDVPVPLLSGNALMLDFGPGTPVERDASQRYVARAWLEAPVREAAMVYVNGVTAGSVWHPPYTLDVRSLLRAGSNQLKIVVANTAINAMAGKALPDYSLLNLRYGERFIPQGVGPQMPLQPLASGILGPLRLVSAP